MPPPPPAAAAARVRFAPVSRAKCVPQRADAGAYPVPNPESLVPALDVAELTGRWWISAGLNPLFDTFDCQQHFFAATGPGSIAAKINWRVQRPNGQFYERSDLQRFVQDPNLPAALYNHGNEVLHYQARGGGGEIGFRERV